MNMYQYMNLSGILLRTSVSRYCEFVRLAKNRQFSCQSGSSEHVRNRSLTTDTADWRLSIELSF